MAEIVDFGLQQHKIKMDSRYFENVLSVVAGDTGRRIEVQLLDTNGMVQDTTGLNLRLNAVVAGKATYTDATLVDAPTGKYQLDLSNGMFLAPGNWQFQWQITDSAGKKLHSFAFTGNVGSNISEGGSQATNFYLNLEDLKKMQDDLINGTIDSSILETNIAEKLTDLETQYAPKLTEVTAQLAQTGKHITDIVNVKKLGVIGVGSTDETSKLQSIIDSYDYIFFPSGTYYFTQLKIKSSKKIVFGENVILKSNHQLNDATQGCIQVEGTVNDRKYAVQQVIKELTNEIYVSVNDSHSLSEGMMLELSQDRPHLNDSSVTNEQEHRQQHAYAILKVKSIDTSTGKIEVYEKIPYDFDLTLNPYVRIVDAVQNVEIIGSTTKYDKMGVKGHGNFFHVRYGYNVKIEGFHCFNGAGKAVEVQNTNSFHVKDITFSEPTNMTVPFGEPIMINKSGYGLIERCSIYYSRRGIDLTNSWFTTVKDCNGYQSSFTCHGLLSRYIVFDNCKVYGKPFTDNNFYGFNFGNTSYMFDEHITINNCYVYGGFYGLQAVSDCKHIKIKNTHFYNNRTAIGINKAQNITFSDCSFTECENDIVLTDVVNVELNCLNILNEQSFSDSNGAIKITGNSYDLFMDGLNIVKNKNGLLYLESVATNANISINNSHLKNLNNGGYMNVGDAKGLDFNNCKTNVRMRLSSKTNLVARNCTMPSWLYGSGNDPVSDFAIINNVITDTLPILATDETNRIYASGNIKLSI